jgi:hypothetical protein
MDPNESRQKRVDVEQELSSLIRKEARAKWRSVRTAQRNERNHHVWRFQSGPGKAERFLRVTHEAMEQGDNASEALYEQLTAGRWLDRLHVGPETALLLTTGGQIEAWPRRD